LNLAALTATPDAIKISPVIKTQPNTLSSADIRHPQANLRIAEQRSHLAHR
jgi:hypothetical protein